MDSSSTKVEDPYYVITDAEQKIFVVSPGKNGDEFNKTVGYINTYPGAEVYVCLYGQGVLIMQRSDVELGAKEFKVVTLNPGRVIEVPVGWARCLVNVGKTYLVVLDNLVVEKKYLDSKYILEKKGLVYYIVEKKGEVGFERNPNYSLYPQITTE